MADGEMDISKELRDKLTPKVTEKLQEFYNGDIDEGLLEYVFLLGASGRNLSEIAGDLEVFFGEEESSSFSEWLVSFLQRAVSQHSSDERDPTPPPRPRHTEPKVQRVQTRSKRKSRSRENRETRPVVEKAAPLTTRRSRKSSRQDDDTDNPPKKAKALFTSKAITKIVKDTHLEPKTPEFIPAAPAQGTVKTRCRFFPNCTANPCPFFHPSEPCRFYPNCSYGSQCMYIHPVAIPMQKGMPCRYGANCFRPDCVFFHPPKPMGNQHPADEQVVCRFDVSCTRIGCRFKHPQRDSRPLPTIKPVETE